MLCFIHIDIYKFRNIDTNLDITRPILASPWMSTDAFASIRHLTVSVCPSSDAIISAVNFFCKSNKYHLTEKYSIKVKNCNIRKCCVLFTSIFISSEILTQI